MLRNFKPTNIIEHSINLKSNACLFYSKILYYTGKEHQFRGRIFAKIEKGGIIAQDSSDWGCRSRISSKKKGLKELWVVYNYIPLNNQAIKSQYLMHCIDKVVDTILSKNIAATLLRIHLMGIAQSR